MTTGPKQSSQPVSHIPHMPWHSMISTFTAFWMLYTFFWVIPRHLNFICQRFGTLCLFHLHRQVGVCRMNSFTHPTMASMWVVTLHSLFLYSDLPPLPCPPPSWWLRPFRVKPFPAQYPKHVPSLVHSTHTYLPMKMEQTECSEMLAYKIQTPGNYPEESIQHDTASSIFTVILPFNTI